jgi:hypothetical protein
LANICSQPKKKKKKKGWSPPAFILLWVAGYIHHSRNAILKYLKALKIMCFLRFSIAGIRFKFNIKKVTRFLYMVQEASQKYRRMFFFFGKNLFSYLVCSQTWLNLPTDHPQFGYLFHYRPP